jgi:hypothetical protein
MSESDPPKRRRLIPLGEFIALAALIVSALGVWIAWQSSKDSGPAQVIEHRTSVPLALRGSIDDRGETLVLTPADPSHALESIVVKIAGASPVEVGSDGRLKASELERALKGRENEAKEKPMRIRMQLDTRYVEAGADRRASGSYLLRYQWEGGGLFGGRSLRLIGFTRA